jgi:hypothetical protein
MIQRKQTIYMLVAAICMALVATLKLYTFNAYGSSVELYTYGAYEVSGEEPQFLGITVKALCMVAVAAISAVLMVVNIFLFKKREVQMSILFSQYVLIAGTILYGLYYVISFSKLYAASIPADTQLTSVPGWTLALPFVALIMNFLAVRGVASDIALLRSIDRIR